MRDENGEIDRAKPALAFETDGADLVVIEQIRDQKQHRAGQRCQHAGAMRLAVAGFNEEKAGAKKNGAETVQRRVESRKLGDGNQWG